LSSQLIKVDESRASTSASSTGHNLSRLVEALLSMTARQRKSRMASIATDCTHISQDGQGSR
jgi:hypothetical protein